MQERRNYGWMIYFVVLILLAVGGIVGNIAFNIGQQLKPAQLSEARLRWREKGPADYDLTFAIFHDRERQPERHIVMVRDRRVVFASCEGEAVHASAAMGAALGLPLATQEPAWTVERIFDRLEELLREQEETKGKNFLVAVFDPKEGYPRRFVRRISRTITREEWNLKMWRPGELEEEARRYR